MCHILRPQSPHPPFGHLLPKGEGDGAARFPRVERAERFSSVRWWSPPSGWARNSLLPLGEGGAVAPDEGIGGRVRHVCAYHNRPSPHPPFGHLLPKGEGDRAARFPRVERAERLSSVGWRSPPSGQTRNFLLPLGEGGAVAPDEGIGGARVARRCGTLRTPPSSAPILLRLRAGGRLLPKGEGH